MSRRKVAPKKAFQTSLAATARTEPYDGLVGGIAEILEVARRTSARAVNAIMTATYWEIGRRTVEYEQKGAMRAEYGKRLLGRLAHDLAARFGRGFSYPNLNRFRQFYLAFPRHEILSTPSRESSPPILQTVSAESSLAQVAARFSLPWSAYVRLLSVRNENARAFYETEALRAGWSVRQLDRQIQSQFYERTALSRNKAAMLRKGAIPQPQDALTAEDEIKDPCVLRVQSVSKAELEELRRRSIRLGANDHVDGLMLGHDSGEETHVRTCLEYEKALQSGFYARNTFEIKMSVFFEHQCGLLAALAQATLPVSSHISEPRVGLPDLHLLPFTFFPDVGESPEPGTVPDQSSYQDKVDAGVLIVKRVGSNILNIEGSEGMGQHLVEVVRADFDGDGLEEILVFEYCYATHGTLGYGGVRLLSRKTAQGPFELAAI